MNFEVVQKGPLAPAGVDGKSFSTFSLPAGETKALKSGQVLKVTAGKVHIRNAEEKAFNNNNSLYAEKGDIIYVKGNVTCVNEDKEQHASFRVFTANKPK